MNADDLARRIVVRHREAGYLRLELPAEIGHPAAVAAIEAVLRQVAGVYRVTFHAAQRRLAVSYDAHVCTAADVARALKGCLHALPGCSVAAPVAAAAEPAVVALPAKLTPALQDAAHQARRAFRQLRSRIEALRQPKAAPGSLQAKLQPMLANALTEKAIINFLNDLVAFYLVKVHWELISQRWLKDPVKYANAWLTVFYLMFLLVRYRKAIAAESSQSAAKPVPAAQP
ncbi:MAG: heavy-metal-associated domain-containing protein [Sulfuritalea sp.]|nr:heavy-metal-associated domain-containing protein [Sulfuritalea sp.]